MTIRPAVDPDMVDPVKGTIYQTHLSTSSNTGEVTGIMAITLGRPQVGQVEVMVDQVPGPAWLRIMIDDINRAATLPENWDSYGGHRLKQKAAEFGIELLEFMGFGGPAPWISPNPDGGIHMEWSRADLGMEIDVSANGDVEVLIEESGEVREWTTGRFGDDELLAFLGRVTDSQLS